MTFEKIVSISYYIGATIVLVGTGLRFLWTFIKGVVDDRETIDDLRQIHIPAIYSALIEIGRKLGLDLELPLPGDKPFPGDKPPSR